MSLSVWHASEGIADFLGDLRGWGLSGRQVPLLGIFGVGEGRGSTRHGIRTAASGSMEPPAAHGVTDRTQAGEAGALCVPMPQDGASAERAGSAVRAVPGRLGRRWLAYVDDNNNT